MCGRQLLWFQFYKEDILREANDPILNPFFFVLSILMFLDVHITVSTLNPGFQQYCAILIIIFYRYGKKHLVLCLICFFCCA